MHAVLTMGLPGAGKSTVMSRTYNVADYTLIDPDVIKTEHPAYDPKNPSTIHEWSTEVAAERLAAALDRLDNLIIDGTGTNAEKMVRYTRTLRERGYTVELLYVRVTLATALSRNKARERTVPDSIILEKSHLIATAYDIVAPCCDLVTVIDND